jgi:aspartate kinase
VTDEVHNEARIMSLGLGRVRRALAEGRIPVVAGFQGITSEGELTTLGRGGSDLTAVALAVGLKACRCELYKDVPGIFTADPRIEPRAGKIAALTYEEMLELASLGASVIHARSVELAGRYGVPLAIRSSFTTEEGTTVGKDESRLERVAVRGVTVDRNQAKVTLRDVPDRPGMAARIFDAVAKAHVNVDMIIQNISAKGSTDLSFTVSQGGLPKVRHALGRLSRELKVPLEEDDGIAKVSVVGVGMRSHSGVAARAFRALGQAGINIQMITTSEIRISCAVSREDAEPAVRALHRAFGLGKPEKLKGRL